MKPFTNCSKSEQPSSPVPVMTAHRLHQAAQRDGVLHVLLLLSSHDSTDFILSHPCRICPCCSKQRICAYTVSAPCTYKPREEEKSILELENFSCLKKHLPSLFIRRETRVLPALLTHNAAHCNIKIPRGIKA